MDEVLAQQVEWKKCQDLVCTEIVVPLDYDDLGAGTTTIEVAKWPAAGESMGSLFLNPGGPGGSGIEEVSFRALAALADKGQEPDPLHENYDQIGFDPRGVATSSPLACLTTRELDAFFATDRSVQSANELADLRDEFSRLAEACAEDPLSAHVSSVEVAEDMDVMRQLFGDEKLNYLGSSYGTRLGATYAALFPDTVGRMVLDGAISPTLSGDEVFVGQLAGFQIALDAWSQDCVDQGDCPLGADKDAVQQSVSDLLASLEDERLQTKQKGRPLTQALAVAGVLGPLYSREGWPALTSSLQAATKGDGSDLLDAADQFHARVKSGYSSNQFEALYAVNCLDFQVNGLGEPVSQDEAVDASPVLGPYFFGEGQSGCLDWPIEPTVEAPDYAAAGAPPIVVIGTTRDPATPYEWAEQLAEVLDSGVLLTREGDGHTGFEQGSSCIDDAVYDFFVEGAAPDNGTTCEQDPEAPPERADIVLSEGIASSETEVVWLGGCTSEFRANPCRG